MMLLYRRLRERYRSFAMSKYPVLSAVYLSNLMIISLGERILSNETMANAVARRLYSISNRSFPGKGVKSPFSDSFRQEQGQAFKNDEDLIAKFAKLNLAESSFCKVPSVVIYSHFTNSLFLVKECEDGKQDSTYLKLHSQMKDKRKDRKKDKGKRPARSGNLTPSISPRSDPPTSSPLCRPEAPTNHSQWTLLTAFGPPPPPKTAILTVKEG
jgi:hypothetical protein